MKFLYKILLLCLFSSACQTATAQLMYALETPSDVRAFALVTFDISNPAQLLSYRAISGLGAYVLYSIEAHPITGKIYGLGVSTSATTQVTVFELNLTSATTAIATPIGSALSLTTGPRYGKYSFVFAPDGSQLHLTTPSGYNYRLDPGTGALLATDAPLSYGSSDANAGQTASVQGLAFATDVAGNSSSTLFGLDRLSGRLVQLSTPTNGLLRTVSNLGIGLEDAYTLSDITTLVGPTPGSNSLYILKTVDTYNGLYSYGVSTLYAIDPVTTQAVSLGSVCSNGSSRLYLTDLAIPSSIISATRDRLDLAGNVTVAPNPVHNSTNLTFTLLRPGRTELTVYDNLGRTVSTVQATLSGGANSLRWDAGMARPGLYLLRLAIDGQPAATRRVVVE